MIVSPLLLLLACVGSCGPGTPLPAAPDGNFPATTLDRTGALPAVRLYLEPWVGRGKYALADSSLAGDPSLPQRVELDLAAHRRKARGPAILPFPFALDGEARRSVGVDTTLTAGGRELTHAGFGGGANTWRLRGENLIIHTPSSTATLEYRGAERLLARRILSRSGLAPSDFVQASLTLGGETRQGLLLTTPSTATWTIPVPAGGATFATWVALDPPAVRDGVSDGLTLVVRAEGEELARRALTASAFEELRVDLGRWAGQSITLQIGTEALGSPDHDYAFLGSPTVWGPPGPEPVRRVIVLGLDTLRPDHLGWFGYPRNTSPELDALANQSAVMVEAWTPAPRTRPSFRAATTGRYPLLAVGATNLGEVFQANGFATAGIVANIHLQPRFDFDHGFDWWHFHGEAKADQQVDRAIDWLKSTADRDSYLFLHIMDPHLPYIPPGPFRSMFVDNPDPDLPAAFNRAQVKAWTRSGEITDQRAEHIVGLYDGEIRFTSQEVGRLLRAVDGMPGQTLIVVHSDHGEEFWEHGDFEHNHTLYDELTRAVLWVRPPGGTEGGPVRVRQPATLADIGPTLYDLLGFTDLPPVDGISLRPYLQDPSQVDRRPIGIAHIQYGAQRWGLTLDQRKYLVFTGTGAEELYDLRADPGEQTNQIGAVDPGPWRQALLQAHPELVGGPGWRVQVALAQGAELRIALPAPAVGAGVLDPEALLPAPANQAWGEQPDKLPADVGEVELADGGRTLVFTGGPQASGVLWVLFGEPTSAEGASATLDQAAILLRPGSDGAAAHGSPRDRTRVEIRPGFVVIPPPGEAARMQIAVAGQATDDEETCRLCVLGYKHGPECAVCEGEDDPQGEDLDPGNP